MSDPTRPISRDDLEAKFREIKVEVDQVTDSAKNRAVPAAVIGGIVFLLIAFLIGKRIGNKKSAVVEIRRI